VADAVRERILAALSDVLYVDDSDFISGDETDLRDLGLDSVRFVLLMKQLDVDRASDLPQRLSENLSVAGWIRELEGR
jgi:aryl carrier-like protein